MNKNLKYLINKDIYGKNKIKTMYCNSPFIVKDAFQISIKFNEITLNWGRLKNMRSMKNKYML